MALKKSDIEKAISPAKDNLFVRTFAPPEELTTHAGLVVTRRATEREVETLQRAQIIKCGPEAKETFKPGQFILYPRFSGIELSTSDLGDATVTYHLITDDAVCAIVEEKYARAELGLDEDRTVSGARRARLAASA